MTEIRKVESSDAREHIIQKLQNFIAVYPSIHTELEFIATKGDAKAIINEIENTLRH